MHDERLIEPSEYWSGELKQSFKEKCEEQFSILSDVSNIDIEANRKTVQKLNCEREKLNNYKNKKSFWVFLLVLSIIALAVIAFVNYSKTGTIFGESSDENFAIKTIGSVFSLYLTVQSILKIKKCSELIKNQDVVVSCIENEAWGEVSPLLNVINTEDFCALVHDCIPSVNIAPFIMDEMIDRLDERSKSENELLNHLNYIADNSNTTVSALSGSVDGKFFIMLSYVHFEMGLHTYTGSISVPYYDYETDMDGKSRRVLRYEVLTASVDKPFPYYYLYHRAMYFSECCPNLSFSRSPINFNSKPERQFKRIVKKSKKKYIKMESSSFTPLSDTEFEALFNTKDRDNDVEFRMMYTPFAIRQFTQLVKLKDGFGDNFYLEKDGCSTSCTIEDETVGNIGTIRPSLGDICSYSYDEIQKKYLLCGQNFFKNFYFLLAPLFMIPIYAEGRDENYDEIFEESDKHSFHELDAESLASSKSEYFRPDGTTTEIMIKVTDSQNLEIGTLFELTSYSFYGVQRIEYVYKVGFHTSAKVPMHWIEFFSKKRNTKMFVIYLGIAQKCAEEVLLEKISNYKTLYKDGFAGILLDEVDLKSKEYYEIAEQILNDIRKFENKTADSKQVRPNRFVRRLIEKSMKKL